MPIQTAPEEVVALHYISEKAGMKDTDKAHIQKVIMEASKDSDYFKREQ